MRKHLYEILEHKKESDTAADIYSIFMMLIIICSIIPLFFKESNMVFFMMDKIAAGIFMIEYILRMVTADFRIKKGKLSFIIYPFTPLAICDILCILPSLSLINSSFRLLKIFRLLQTFKVFRAFKMVRYSKSKRILMGVYRRQKKPISVILLIAFGYIIIAALTLFNVEPDLFDNFLDAMYWATVSLTTIGYGDIVPVTVIGKIITVISAMFGIAIIALPSGMITAGIIHELRDIEKNENFYDAKKELDEEIENQQTK